jgi:hypothetical protein
MKILPFLISATLFSSCLLKPKLTGKVWNLVDVSTPATATLYKELGEQSPSLGGLGSFLRFYDNGTYTGKLMTGFHYGYWSQEDGVLSLTIGDTAKLRYKVVSQKGDNLVLHMIGGGDKTFDADLRYESGPVEEDTAIDAFSLENNRWEIPAKHREPDAEILARVKSHLHCQLLYIQKAIDKGEESLSTTEFVSPLTFYGNGIALSPEAQVPGDWTRLFYDSADASRAYTALKNGFRSSIQVPDTKNTFLLYKSLLEQLYTKVYLDTTTIVISPASTR